LFYKALKILRHNIKLLRNAANNPDDRQGWKNNEPICSRGIAERGPEKVERGRQWGSAKAERGY